MVVQFTSATKFSHAWQELKVVLVLLLAEIVVVLEESRVVLLALESLVVLLEEVKVVVLELVSLVVVLELVEVVVEEPGPGELMHAASLLRL